MCYIFQNNAKSTKTEETETPTILIIHLKRFGSESQKIDREVRIDDQININSNNFQLIAIIRHIGENIDSSHYTAFCRYPPNLNCFHSNGSKITLKKIFDRKKAKDAYILVYRRLN
jgi:ubiquitin C-terminal hydrolase